MNARLFVDEKEIPLNKFLRRMFSGMIAGAVLSLRGIKENWKKIRVEIEK